MLTSLALSCFLQKKKGGGEHVMSLPKYYITMGIGMDHVEKVPRALKSPHVSENSHITY